jgi:GT2 family glycosyltransferase
VSILIPSAGRGSARDGQAEPFLYRCLDSVCRLTKYDNFEILVIDNGNLASEVERSLARWPVRRVTILQPFNFAANLNRAAARARGDFLLFLNDDTEVLDADWLKAMVAMAGEPGVGAVGAKLFFPDGRLQHVGVVIPSPGPTHHYYGQPGDFPGYQGNTRTPRHYLAVTGACLLTSRRLFQALGGFEERFSLNYNDVDYCLRLYERGFRIVFTPDARLCHHESMGREGQDTVRPWELELFHARWGHWCGRDPYGEHSPPLAGV